MAKCAICGSRIGLLSKPVKLYDEEICRDCWTRLGFGPEDVEKYKYKSSKYLAKGKATIKAEEEATARKAEAEARIKHYTFRVVGVAYEYDGTNPQKILSKYIREHSDSSDYQGMTAKMIRDEYGFDDKIFKFEPAAFEPVIEETTFEGSPALRVFLDGCQIGWIAAEKVDTFKDLMSKGGDMSGEVVGGPYKFIDLIGDAERVRTSAPKDSMFGALITVTIER